MKIVWTDSNDVSILSMHLVDGFGALLGKVRPYHPPPCDRIQTWPGYICQRRGEEGVNDEFMEKIPEYSDKNKHLKQICLEAVLVALENGHVGDRRQPRHKNSKWSLSLPIGDWLLSSIDYLPIYFNSRYLNGGYVSVAHAAALHQPRSIPNGAPPAAKAIGPTYQT